MRKKGEGGGGEGRKGKDEEMLNMMGKGEKGEGRVTCVQGEDRRIIDCKYRHLSISPKALKQL